LRRRGRSLRVCSGGRLIRLLAAAGENKTRQGEREEGLGNSMEAHDGGKNTRIQFRLHACWRSVPFVEEVPALFLPAYNQKF
jgi:hypothetical protein